MEFITDTAELFNLLALSFVPGIGVRSARALLQYFGGASGVMQASLKEIRHIDGIGEVRAKGFNDPAVWKQAERELAYLERNAVKVLPFGVPKRLANCSDAPILLYYKGEADLDMPKTVAIVGTRKNTDYGMALCEELVAALSAFDDLAIISGLALGIDAIAHKKALQCNMPTVGVLGHGLDRIYPYNHKALSEKMLERGGLLTEFPSETIPDRNNFPMRNRIVAGISDVTVVIESNIAGGALITAFMANGYNREVMAYPGRVNDTRSAGCNEIIRTNIASMITKPDDLIDLMGWGKQKKDKTVQRQLFLDLSPDEMRLTDLLQGKEAVHADELLIQSGIPNTALAATLLQLEMQGLVKSLPGKRYRLA